MKTNKKPILVGEEVLNNRQFDLGVNDLEELAKLIGVSEDSPEFIEYLTEANKLSWVNNAPKDIQDAIKSHRVK
jgi:hypothetical protein